jgi:hypothetical protein
MGIWQHDEEVFRQADLSLRNAVHELSGVWPDNLVLAAFAAAAIQRLLATEGKAATTARLDHWREAIDQ